MIPLERWSKASPVWHPLDSRFLWESRTISWMNQWMKGGKMVVHKVVFIGKLEMSSKHYQESFDNMLQRLKSEKPSQLKWKGPLYMEETEVQINSHLKIRPRCSHLHPAFFPTIHGLIPLLNLFILLPCVTLWANMFQMFITTIMFALPSSFFINHAYLTLDMGESTKLGVKGPEFKSLLTEWSGTSQLLHLAKWRHLDSWLIPS